jgi:hypothetical protein
LFHVFETYSADLALRLGDDMSWLKTLEQGRIYAIDAEGILENCFDALIDLVAGPFDVELWARADGKAGDRVRIIAFVRSSDELVFEAERAKDFSCAGDEGDDSVASGHVSPGIGLSIATRSDSGSDGSN